MSIEKLKVPDLGDASEVEVIELLVSVGQSVEENDSLLVLESDKAAMEIPAPMAGVVKSISVNLGDQVSTGSEMLSLEVAESNSQESAPVEEPKAAAETPTAEPAVVEETTSAPVAASSPTSQTIEIPDLGSDDEVEIIEIHIKEKDTIEVDDVLITLESDKAAMDVPAPYAGVIESLLVAVGDKVKTGSQIAKVLATAPVAQQEAAQPVETAAASKLVQEEAKPAPVLQQAAAAPQSTGLGNEPSKKVYAGPAVRKMARELGVDLGQVKGSGAKSRILKEDVQAFVKSRINAPAGQGVSLATIPDIDFSKFGEVEQVQRSKLHKLTAVKMHRDWSSVPQVAQFNEVDVTDLEEFRAGLKPEAERRGTKLTFLPFLLKACAKALLEYPQFNVSLHSSGEYVIQKKYVHIGMAVATEAGLVVPVIRNVDQKTIWQLADEVIELSNKAKSRKLKPEEMQGGCFTISSLGAIGGTGFIPIVNAPEVAILGVARTDIKPVYIGGEFIPRKVLPITLTYDHKAVNGVDGGLFATYLGKLLGDVRHLAL
ncbi:MAG: dihydrolipoamide acetyltransferase [SAR86 cluster bacterium]|uniref:Dihydrolipoamide acetyltransferase component of pyruvate dehydrogenase complex n=1 Tax=SAR86 cluster bacterium TaxID=2030880 RepID=A0A2A4XHE5_9GAMM|nr:MAG: dihydrolipoamide acetyltransferase [SAR86 cluster bacterium]